MRLAIDSDEHYERHIEILDITPRRRHFADASRFFVTLMPLLLRPDTITH